MSNPPDITYGFIGIGNMGWGMCMNVRKKIPTSSKLLVCELDRDRRDRFCSEAKRHGVVEAAENPKQLAEQCDIIITSLPTGPAVMDVFTDPTTGILAATTTTTKPDDRRILFLDTSTIEVSTSRAVLEKVEASGLGEYIDAPVSGGIPAAEQGTLTFMVGGSKATFARARPVMELMGTQFFHCGKPGAGLATKQINNYIAYCSYIALCEGMHTGVQYGLDPKTLSDVINASSGSCWNSLHMNPVKGVQPHSSASRDFQGGFRTELAKGVIDMAVQLMDDVGAKHVLADVVQHVYARGVESPLCKEQESRSVFRLFTEDGGKGLGNTKIE